MPKFAHIAIATLLLFAFLTQTCSEDVTPKPRGYFRISFPEKVYKQLDKPLPYNFLVPVYSAVTPDLLNPDQKDWITLEIAGNNAQIHISYKKIENNLAKLIEESRTLVYNHSAKASSIEEKIYINHAYKTYGTLYTLKGNAASPMQFYLTDSVKNFIRGALYFKELPNYDSLRPVINFLSADVIKMIETTKWEDSNGR
jgi:gliding motility-associated lipoprotein GldD